MTSLLVLIVVVLLCGTWGYRTGYYPPAFRPLAPFAALLLGIIFLVVLFRALGYAY